MIPAVIDRQLRHPRVLIWSLSRGTALPKEAQISAAPKSLNKGLLIPINELVPQTPLTSPSNLPKQKVPISPPEPQHLPPRVGSTCNYRERVH